MKKRSIVRNLDAYFGYISGWQLVIIGTTSHNVGHTFCPLFEIQQLPAWTRPNTLKVQIFAGTKFQGFREEI